MFPRLLLVIVLAVSGCAPSYAISVEVISPICVIHTQSGIYQTCSEIKLLIEDDIYYIPSNYKSNIGVKAQEAMLPLLVHDWFYKNTCDFSRLDTDKILHKMLVQNGVDEIRAYIIYIFARLFGWHYYNEDYCE